jgi:predicted DNA-binding transcriptional regulator AlpA|tara:strand:+ start:19687 stop:19905 length:219 start_codon:yes stop_codon:yes gene_type:complete
MAEPWVSSNTCIEHLGVSRDTFYSAWKPIWREGTHFRYKNPLKPRVKVWKLSEVEKTAKESSRVLARRAGKK